MPSDRQWDAAATIEVDGKRDGPFLLGTPDAVTIGRSDRAGLRSPSPRGEMPRELARLRATRAGWMLENEGMTVGRGPYAVRVKGAGILSKDGALFAPHAWILLARGDWILKWDVGVTVTVEVRPVTSENEPFHEVADEPRRGEGMGTLALDTVRLTDLERRNMAALFAYLIRGELEPREPFAEAARLLNIDPTERSKTRQLIKAQLPKVTRRVNRMRSTADALTTPDEIGRYLVDLTQTLGADDLED